VVKFRRRLMTSLQAQQREEMEQLPLLSSSVHSVHFWSLPGAGTTWRHLVLSFWGAPVTPVKSQESLKEFR